MNSLTNKTLTHLRMLKKTSLKTIEQWKHIYGLLTGLNNYGIEQHFKGLPIKNKYRLEEILEYLEYETEGQEFTDFFNFYTTLNQIH